MKNKNILLISLIIFFCIFSIHSLHIEDNQEKLKLLQQKCTKKEKNYFFRSLATDTCATTSYSRSDIQTECNKGPNSYDKVLKYPTFQNYITDHSYHSNGLNYVTSLFVDSDTHHFGNFMNDGVGMIILYIIDGLMLIGWVPLLICWKKRCLLFDDCLYEDDCCIIFWHILTYFLAAAMLSFLIVVLCFGR